MNDNNIVPSDEELALFAEAGQEVIDRLRARIREQATERPRNRAKIMVYNVAKNIYEECPDFITKLCHSQFRLR